MIPEVALDARNSMCYWWPLVKNLPVPMPKTIIIEPGYALKRFFCDIMDLLRAPKGTKPPEPEWLSEIQAAADELGYPCFMRTDQASGKHDWERTCFVATSASVRNHVFAVCEANEEADILGLPYRAIVVREYVQTAAAFSAFWGKLPIGKERRYFVRDGQVQCWHPYWAQAAIRWASTPNWAEQLKALNTSRPGEEELLSGYARRIGEVLDGYWSVDFMCGANGRWYFIDAALGEASWHPDCEYVAEEPTDRDRGMRGVVADEEEA